MELYGPTVYPKFWDILQFFGHDLVGFKGLDGGADLKEWRAEKQKAEATKPRLFNNPSDCRLEGVTKSELHYASGLSFTQRILCSREVAKTNRRRSTKNKRIGV